MSDIHVLKDLREICAGLPPMPDDASHVQERVIIALVGAGYKVFHEYAVTMPDGRAGRIDIVTVHPSGRWIAIEIDARKPRKRSIQKMGLGRWLKVSCLRGVSEGSSDYPGTDAVIALPVRLASFQEKQSKSRVAAVGSWARALR